MASTVSRRRANAVQLSRARAADRWLPGFRRAIRTMLRKQTNQAVDAFQDAANVNFNFQSKFGIRWTREGETLKKRWMFAMVAAGYKWAEKEVVKAATGKTGAPIKGKQIGSPGPDEPLRAVIGEGDDFLIRARFKDIDKWVETTAEAESATKSKTLQRILEKASTETVQVTTAAGRTYLRGVTVAEMAKRIRASSLKVDDHRASMLARTGTIWAFNEGAQQRYRTAGVQAESWVVTDDDALCPFCQEMDGKIVRLDDPFATAGSTVDGVNDAGNPVSLSVPFEVEHPPLHPNCRCTIIPILSETDLLEDPSSEPPKSQAEARGTRQRTVLETVPLKAFKRPKKRRKGEKIPKKKKAKKKRKKKKKKKASR